MLPAAAAVAARALPLQLLLLPPLQRLAAACCCCRRCALAESRVRTHGVLRTQRSAHCCRMHLVGRPPMWMK
jgi:hypothetical protein